jgi:DNA polymerase, archaea type
VGGDGIVRTTTAGPGGERIEGTAPLRPFAWLGSAGDPSREGLAFETLRGEGAFRALVHADSPDRLDEFLKAWPGPQDSIRPLESQWLLQQRERLYRGLHFGELRRCQLDIETFSADGSFSDAKKAGDRVLAVGLRCGGPGRILALEAMSDEAEKSLLLSLNSELAALDPDVIEGHNIFRFDLEFLRERCRRHRVPCLWGRYGARASFRPSRLKVAERWIEFTRCDLPGRAVVDTYLLALLHDITARELTSFGLKAVAAHFGISKPDGRTMIEGDRIGEAFLTDRARFDAYLLDDLRETAGLADLFLPTYFEQARAFPILLQEAMLRGTTAKIDLLLIEEYYHARQACPLPPEMSPFEGGFTRSFREGVFRHVLHFDVASLYPSLLLHIGRNPANDTLGVFIPLLRRLREYRLECKELARRAPTEAERDEAQARQAAFKILINSFYGYLGFSGARFGDSALAAEVTRLGREFLQALIAGFEKAGAIILEADTDGIYLSSERHFASPEAMLREVAAILPEGIELEFDGRYEAMFCYKAKNYALYDGREVTLRGSALRSRGIEPYLQRLTDQMIDFLLGASTDSPLPLAEETRKRIATRSVPVEELAKSESLSQGPDAYERFIAEGGKPRRASAEAALQLTPRPRMGERVSYYITPKAKGRTSDWQRARPVALYHPDAAPYDPAYYIGKIDDWLERYGPFLGVKPAPAVEENQGELGMS